MASPWWLWVHCVCCRQEPPAPRLAQSGLPHRGAQGSTLCLRWTEGPGQQGASGPPADGKASPAEKHPCLLLSRTRPRANQHMASWHSDRLSSGRAPTAQPARPRRVCVFNVEPTRPQSCSSSWTGALTAEALFLVTSLLWVLLCSSVKWRAAPVGREETRSRIFSWEGGKENRWTPG